MSGAPPCGPLVSSLAMARVQRHSVPGAAVPERGHALYEREILPRLDPDARGKFLALDVDSGGFG